MDAVEFRNLLTNFTALTEEEFNTIEAQTANFPYCQVFQLMASRGAQDLKASNQQSMLHRAAVYSTDRAVLKRIMTSPALARTQPVIPEEETIKPVIPPVAVAAPTVEPKVDEPIVSKDPVPLDGDALRDDLNFQLHRLHELMHQFDDSYEKLKGKAPAKPKPTASKQPEPAPSPSGTEAPLIEEIKTSKRKPKIVSPKVAEQGEIIDNFIKVAPTLPRTKPKEPGPDLAEDSVNYGDNIVSETLVEILLKQGKKAKAIEMLKKLIWKFPQKKAYFAAQIEALKG